MTNLRTEVWFGWELRQDEYWSGLLFPTPGDLSDLDTEPTSLAHLLHWQADSLPLRHLRSPNWHPIFFNIQRE